MRVMYREPIICPPIVCLDTSAHAISSNGSRGTSLFPIKRLAIVLLPAPALPRRIVRIRLMRYGWNVFVVSYGIVPSNPLAHLRLREKKRNHASRFGAGPRRGQSGNKPAHGALNRPRVFFTAHRRLP